MSIRQDIGKRFRQARKKAGLSVEEVAKKLNLSIPCVGGWERGMRIPRVYEILKIAEVLNVDPSYLVCFSDPENAHEELSSSLINKVIPILSFKTAINYDEILEKGKLAILKSREYLSADYHTNSKLFALKIEDDSMSPEFIPADIIIIAPSIKALPGKYVLAKMGDDDKAVFRKLRQQISSTGDGYVYQLVALNADWPVAITLNLAKGDQILGVLVEHRRHHSHSGL